MKPSRNTGFTLIELLFVVAIVGILVTLLIPIVKNITELTNNARCKNLFKSQGAAFLQFANDNDGWIATTCYDDPNAGRQALLKYLTGGSDGKYNTAFICPAAAKWKDCQDDPRAWPTPDPMKYGWDSMWTSTDFSCVVSPLGKRVYTDANGPMLSPPTTADGIWKIRFNQISTPSSTLIAADTQGAEKPIFTLDAIDEPTSGYLMWRHHSTSPYRNKPNGKANRLMADGSVSEMARGQGDGQADKTIWVNYLP